MWLPPEFVCLFVFLLLVSLPAPSPTGCDDNCVNDDRDLGYSRSQEGRNVVCLVCSRIVVSLETQHVGGKLKYYRRNASAPVFFFQVLRPPGDFADDCSC